MLVYYQLANFRRCFFNLHLYHKNIKNIILSYLSDLTLVSDREGIDNPFIALVARFLFVCVGARDLSVASYWIDTLVLKTEGNTYTTLLHHPFLFKGKPTHAQEVARRIFGAVAGEIYAKSSQDLISRQCADFWGRCRGDVCTSLDIPSTYHKLLSLTLYYLPFASRFPLPHF